MSTEPEKSLQILEWTRAENVAELCKGIVKATALKIGESQHVTIDGWQSIAAAFGMTAGTDEPYRVEGGWRCKATLKRDSDGAIISTAYALVGDDEPLWMGRPQHSREGMVQTRASSRVLAQKFRFVVTMMKVENLKTTPAEEMTAEKPKGYTELVGVVKDISFQNGYFGCFINHKRCWSQEQGIGAQLDKYSGREVLAKAIERPSKKEGKPNSYQLLSIEPIVEEVPLAEESDDIPE